MHEVFNVVFGNVYFVIVISYIHCRKLRCSASSQIFIAKNSIFGQFEVIFLNVYSVPGREWFLPVNTFKEVF